jgi:hypothetical protein
VSEIVENCGNLRLVVAAAALFIALGICPLTHEASKYKVLHNFTGGDGAGPYAGVIVDQNSNPYGATAGAGAHRYGQSLK